MFRACRIDGSDERNSLVSTITTCSRPAAAAANARAPPARESRGADPNAATAAAAAWLCASAASEAGSEGRTIDAFSLISDSNASFSRRTEVR